MAKDRNYTGTTRFIEDATVLTADYGYTGDIAFEVKPGETTTTTEYVEATSTDAGALKVVADDYPSTTTTTFTKVAEGTEGALKVVADDASPFDAETQIKISDVTGITVEVGDYVTKTVTPGFDANTMVKIGDVTGDIADAQVGDYVKLETTSTTTPSSCTGAYVKLDKEWIAFPTGDKYLKGVVIYNAYKCY